MSIGVYIGCSQRVLDFLEQVLQRFESTDMTFRTKFESSGKAEITLNDKTISPGPHSFTYKLRALTVTHQ